MSRSRRRGSGCSTGRSRSGAWRADAPRASRADQPPARRDERRHEALSLVEAGAEHRAAGGACRDPLATTASLKKANAWYHSTSETSKPVRAA